ncbi:MAG: Permease of the drug/metabolite transporter (DMT) superfamily [uncultured Solirubrobacteraceae bacterium]|uniref:Permease of the drug/metabolite transporter (DMT) superfamily n=1 Tax=uncultured Solirubrobacteraceae bacterium TaxID=1162706 RepID=A0A6J4SEI5_9ACTN|nr:MAG: Permease of the drug/metabolite transporter (DMT) superfamily [uncultured Solirubrobacteraceae bacterium]
MSRPVVWSLYAILVLVWSSTWVSIKIGLEDLPVLFGAGIRFAIAGVVLLAGAAATRRTITSTDWRLAALLGALPFATTYGLIYWAEQYVPSGLAAVLFGVLPLYVALLASVLLPQEPLRPRLLLGIGVAIAGLALAFRESLDLGDAELAGLAAGAVLVSPIMSAIGNVAIKLRGAQTDAIVLNGHAMLFAGVLLLALSAPLERWGDTAWSAEAIGSIAYLALAGTAFTFVTLTILLRELPAVTMSFISVLLPFGALAFGALLEDERITPAVVGGAALVASGIAIAQLPARRPAVP